jgi:hypothetical protein
MPDLYIANCTKQNHVFAYRVPGENGVKSLSIAIGQQSKLPGLSNAVAGAIIEANSRYGLIEVKEIDRTKPFIGMCYSLDAPVKIDVIIKAMKHNDEVLIQRGRETRQAAAVASNNLIENHLHEANESNQLNADMRNFEMTIVEEDPKNIKDSNDKVEEGITVNHSADPDKITQTKRTSARGRRN